MSGETVGISSLFHHVDLAIASAHLMPGGPFTGDNVFETDESGGAIGLTSGVIYRPTVFPPYWGHKKGFQGLVFGQDMNEDIYQPAWGYLTTWTLLVSGLYLATQRQALDHAVEFVLWDESLPQALSLHIEPGWSVDMYTIHL